MKKIRIIIFGVFALAVIVFLIYGISTHEEPGFIEEAPTWSRSDFPLDVRAVMHTTGESVRDSEVRAAMNLANDRLGFIAFQWADEREDPEVIVTLQAPSEPGFQDPGGDSSIVAIGGHANQCLIVQSNTAGAGDLTIKVLYHELGHCLTLQHDCFFPSIMCGGSCCTLSPTPDRQIPEWITDYDRSIIRERWAPQ